MNRRKTRTTSKKRWALVLLAVLAVGLPALYFLEIREDRERTRGLMDEPVPRVTVEYNGRMYRYRDEFTACLIIGTDETLDSTRVFEEENLNNRQADYITVLFTDRKQEEYTALQISRETYMQIRSLNADGSSGEYVSEHLNNAYSFGTGGKDSCRNVAEAVSRLLLGIPIDHYLAMTMDGIPVLNDLVGGVTVTVEQDLTSADPTFVKGATVTLNGEQAERFVRARKAVTAGQNQHRMERQSTYMLSLYSQMRKKLSGSESFALEFVEAVSPYILSDMTTNELAKMADQLSEYDFEGIRDIEGSTYYNYMTGYNEFYPDEDALKEQLISLCFRPMT